jgi:hypothetical protein
MDREFLPGDVKGRHDYTLIDVRIGLSDTAQTCTGRDRHRKIEIRKHRSVADSSSWRPHAPDL